MRAPATVPVASQPLPGGKLWHEAFEDVGEVGVYYFTGGLAPGAASAKRLQRTHVYTYGELYVLRRLHELSGGAFDLARTPSQMHPKGGPPRRIRGNGGV